MHVKITHYNNLNQESISKNFNTLLTKTINYKKSQKMPTVSGSDIDISKFTTDQLKQLAKLLKDSGDDSNEGKTILSHILSDDDPIKIKAKTANQRIVHPWCKHLSLFSPDLMSGNDVTVDVARASDFSIFKAITAWCLEDDKQLTAHKKSLLRIIQKINETEFQLFRPSGKTFSLMMQLVFYVDAAYHNEGKCEDTKVDEMVATFRNARGFYQGPPVWGNNDDVSHSKQSSFNNSRKRNFNQSSFQQNSGYNNNQNVQTGYMPNLYQNQQLNPFTQSYSPSNWVASMLPNNQN